MTRTTGPSLDDEGVPDLDGPLPEKEATGDPQEGTPPPGDRPRASVDWGVTADQEIAGEPIGVRVGREVPDIGATDPVDEVAEDLGLVPSASDDVIALPAAADSNDLEGRELVGDDILDDTEADLVALAPKTDPAQGQSAEEAAMRIIDENDEG